MGDTSFKGAKVIRLKRSNLWDRYKSMLTAQSNGVWHARDADDDVNSNNNIALYVPVKSMIYSLMLRKRLDDEADEWAKAHASEVLNIDYEECKASPDKCQSILFDFLGVDITEADKAETSVLAFVKGSDPLEGIENREEVAEALGSNGFGDFIGLSNHTQLQLLIYETEALEATSTSRHVWRAMEMGAINVTVIGQGTNHKGFGSKYAAAVSGLYCIVLCISISCSVYFLSRLNMYPHFLLHYFLSSQRCENFLKIAWLYSVTAEMCSPTFLETI